MYNVIAHKVEANSEDLYLEGSLDYIETGMNLELPQLYEQLPISVLQVKFMLKGY